MRKEHFGLGSKPFRPGEVRSSLMASSGNLTLTLLELALATPAFILPEHDGQGQRSLLSDPRRKRERDEAEVGSCGSFGVSALGGDF